MEAHFIEDIVIIFILAIGVIFLFQKINVPSIVGFLLTGVLAGPHGFGLIQSTEEIEFLAEIGLILLLFAIGIEFSLKSLMNIRRIVFLGGGLQVLITILLTFILVRFLGRSLQESFFMGFMVALSSTALVLRALQESAAISTDYGKATVGILIFQDLIIVPMMLLTPIIAGKSGNIIDSMGLFGIKLAGIAGITFIGAKYVVPRMLHQIAKTKNRELFLISIIAIGFAVAWFTSAIGLSLALGAFIAGLTISESEYSHHAFGNIVPFRDVFASFFFVSIGMLLDLSFFGQNVFLVLAIAFGVISVKTIIAGFVAFLLGYPFRTTVIVGLAISQVGEFSFILSQLGLENGILQPDYYQLLIAVAVITMALAPFIILLAPYLSDQILKLPLPDKLVKGLRPLKNEEVGELSGHLVIIGMGLNGRNVARAAKVVNIPYVIVDFDPDIVKQERERGEPVYFGDATQESMLRLVKVQNAEVLVVAISDPTATFRITSLLYNMNPKAHVIIRTRYLSDVESLYNEGANEVIPEEFETSVEIFSRVLNKYLIPRDDIEKLVAEIRSDNYGMLRKFEPDVPKIYDLKERIPDIEINALKVEKGCSVEGKTIEELNLRRTFGVNILAISREGNTFANPMKEEIIYPGDILYVLGTQTSVACITSLFREPEEPSCVDDYKSDTLG